MKKITTIILLTITLLCGLTACGPNGGGDTPIETTHTGQILDIYFQPINNVAIKYENKLLGQTDELGNFSIVTNNFKGGSIVFEKTGYAFRYDLLMPNENEYFYRDLFAVPVGIDPNAPICFMGKAAIKNRNDGIPDVEVYLIVDAQSYLIGKSDEHGNMNFPFIFLQGYLEFKKEGYKFVPAFYPMVYSVTDVRIEGELG
jgi:hypothetical protein